MSSIFPRTKTLKSAISFCIPALLTLIAAVILTGQSSTDIVLFGVIISVQAAVKYAELAQDTRNAISAIDYSRAEKLCPQKMPITGLMAEAARKLA